MPPSTRTFRALAVRCVGLVIAALLTLGLVGEAHARPEGSLQTPLVLASVIAPQASPLMSQRPGAGLLIQAQSRACRLCRRDCVADWKYDCGTSAWCRRQFTLCMRACWYDYCR